MKSAKQGNAQAQHNVGAYYAVGKGVPQSLNEAGKWYTKAAEQGIARAQFSLGYTYETGRGVPVNHAEAAKWYLKAAEQNIPAAQFLLSKYYLIGGNGIEANPVQGIKWLTIAASGGHKTARKLSESVNNEFTTSQVSEGKRLAEDWIKKRRQRK